jgi:TonB family protein
MRLGAYLDSPLVPDSFLTRHLRSPLDVYQLQRGCTASPVTGRCETREVSVDKNGRVSKVVVLKSSAQLLLQQEATRNISEWTFTPGEERVFELVYEFRRVMPEIDYLAPSRVTVDFPNRVHIETNFKTIMWD